MTDQEKFMEVATLAYEMGYDEALKRLSPTGSGAMTCFAGREAGKEQGGAEGLREDWRVSPGEAKAARLEVTRWEMLAARQSELASQEWVAKEAVTRDHFHRCLAAVYETCARRMTPLLPKPDSKLVKRASGRRND